MEWNLVIAKGEHKGQTIPIRLNPFVIGRDNDCQLRPASRLVSHRHCLLIRRGNALVLRDCHSTNGTFVNARKVGEVELRPGDRLGIGPLAFVVSRKGQEQPTTPRRRMPRIVSEEAIGALLLEMDMHNADGREHGAGGAWLSGSSFCAPEGEAEKPPAEGSDAAPERPPLSPAEVATAILKKKSLDWLRPKT